MSERSSVNAHLLPVRLRGSPNRPPLAVDWRRFLTAGQTVAVDSPIAIANWRISIATETNTLVTNYVSVFRVNSRSDSSIYLTRNRMHSN